jgi:hypothetical protein
MAATMAAPMSALQLELLKVYSFQPSDEDLVNIQKMLATYFADKLLTKIDKSIEEKGISEQDLEAWLNEG